MGFQAGRDMGRRALGVSGRGEDPLLPAVVEVGRGLLSSERGWAGGWRVEVAATLIKGPGVLSGDAL